MKSEENISSTFTNESHDVVASTLPSQISFALFPCMVFTGVICNTLIFVIMRRRRMSHLSTCYYMGILAIADTSVLLLGLSVMWLYLVNRKWSLVLQSTYGCKLLSLLFYTVSDTSVWLVCMMSADRCIAVTRPLHASSICTVRRARISVCVLVLCMLLINIHFLFTHYLSAENDCTSHERYQFFIRQLWPWIDAAVYSVIPFIFLLTINLIIVRSLFQARRSRTHLRIYQSQRNRNQNQLSTSMSRKLTTMLLAVTFFFLLTSFPMVCLQIYTNLSDQNNHIIAQSYLKPLCETLQYSNHCVTRFESRLDSSVSLSLFSRSTSSSMPSLEKRFVMNCDDSFVVWLWNYISRRKSCKHRSLSDTNSWRPLVIWANIRRVNDDDHQQRLNWYVVVHRWTRVWAMERSSWRMLVETNTDLLCVCVCRTFFCLLFTGAIHPGLFLFVRVTLPSARDVRASFFSLSLSSENKIRTEWRSIRLFGLENTDTHR